MTIDIDRFIVQIEAGFQALDVRKGGGPVAGEDVVVVLSPVREFTPACAEWVNVCL